MGVGGGVGGGVAERVWCSLMPRPAGSVQPGCMLAQWVPGGAGGGGGFGAAVQRGAGAADVLRAGRLQGDSLEGIGGSTSVPSSAAVRTAVSLRSDGPCEMLVAHRYGASMDLRRVRLSDGAAGPVYTMRVSNAAAIRMLPVSQRFGARPESYVGLVVANDDSGDRLDLLTVPVAERCGPAM